MLDSCVVIELIKKKGFAERVKTSLRGKLVHIVLCDVVLREVKKITGIESTAVISMISKRVRRNVTVVPIDNSQRIFACSTTEQYQFCHMGDNFILTLCHVKGFILLTFDKMLLTACNVMGVVAFHPAKAREI